VQRIVRDGTLSDRDSRTAGSALPTSGPGPHQRHSENPASSTTGRGGPQQERRANPVGSAAGGSGTQRQCKEPSPSTTGGNAGESVSLRPIIKKKETNEKRGIIFKIPHLQRFGLSVEWRDAKSSAIQSVSCRFCFASAAKRNQLLLQRVSGNFCSP
jgi:hypothetical protein